MSKVLLHNTTRYYTEDLAAICELMWNKSRPNRIDVAYYSPSSSAKKQYYEAEDTGLFVKMLRNGDEESNIKALRLVRPTRFDGVSELEQIAASGSNTAPAEVVRQVMRRCQLADRYRWDKKGPPWTKCLIGQRGREHYNELIAKHGLILRFHASEPTQELIDWRYRLIEVIRQQRRNNRSLTQYVDGIESNRKAIREASSRIEGLIVKKAAQEQEIQRTKAAIQAVRDESEEYKL